MCQNSQISAASHHDAGLTILLARSGFNHHAGFGRGSPAQLPHEALHAGIALRETVAVHQVLPDRHRVATLCQFGFNHLPVGFASARRGAAAWLPRRFFGLRVGGHLYGRFCRIPSPPTWRTYRDSRSPEICPGRFTANVCRSLNAPQRPSQPPQRDDLLFLFFAQDIPHVTERNSPPVQCPDLAISLAGFQVSTYGRFWVSPEDGNIGPCIGALRRGGTLVGFGFMGASTPLSQLVMFAN